MLQYYSNSKEYLTEEKLGYYLKLIYPNVEWVHDKAFPNNRFRPDYVCHELNIVVEFDGYQHYTVAKTIIRDMAKDKILKELGYTVIRIPYFIQMSTEIVKKLFEKTIVIEQVFPHGFISSKSTMIFSADFNELGVDKFNKYLIRFQCVREDILNSMRQKAREIGVLAVFPKSLEHMADTM